MAADGRGCGSLYGLYVAAREEQPERMRATWEAFDGEGFDGADLEPVAAAVEAGDAEAVRDRVSDLLFRDAEAPAMDGPLATAIGTLLYAFGYLASFVLFFRAHSRDAVVRRLRWAYRTVGVDIRDAETVDGVSRTTFRCPYRNLGADRYGRRHVCHDVLDRVDDGYVTFLKRHRDLEYQRPRACAASECCYSEVAER